MVRAELLARIVLGHRVSAAIVHYGPRVDPRRIAEALQPRGLRASLLQPGSGAGSGGARAAADRRRELVAFAQGESDILLAPLAAGALAPTEREELAPSHLIYFDLPAGGIRAASAVGRGTTVVALADRGQEKELAKLQEAIGVAFTRKDIPSDEEVLTGAIDRALKRMKDEDKGELALLRARIRRQVPLLQRPLFMASLLKALLPVRVGAPVEKPSRSAGPARAARPLPAPAAPEAAKVSRGRFGRNAASGPARPGPCATGKASLPSGPSRAGAGSSRQLFVSIGRNRRVFARDLIALFTEKLQPSPPVDIGDVRVFEKYSFVDIVPAGRGEAIEKLSGTQLKGRTIAVNYAKKKEEKEET